MNSLQQLVGQSPIAGPLIFVLIQIIQVVIPNTVQKSTLLLQG
jgi:hypothetical protein